jgi:hypothetical protein
MTTFARRPPRGDVAVQNTANEAIVSKLYVQRCLVAFAGLLTPSLTHSEHKRARCLIRATFT